MISKRSFSFGGRGAIVLLVLLCILGAGVPMAFAAPKAYLEKATFDLGPLKEGKLYEFGFPVFNKGDSDLVVESIYAPCGCVKVLQPTARTTITPGSKLDVKYSFNSMGLNGEITKFIYLLTNDKNNLNLKVAINANVEVSPEVMLKRFGSFNLLTMVGAGLVDGINPCAFTVLVFFISFLSFVGYKRQQIVILGSFFILAVFLTYILIGVGLFEFFRRLEFFYSLSWIVYLLTAILALFLGVLSLYDYWIFKKTGDAERIKLRLPDLVKQQIHKVIREKTDPRGRLDLKAVSKLKLALAALSSGFIVSILESVCTGQMYLPTILYVLGFSKGFNLKAMGYLLLYNLMFILPLVGIFILGLFGMTSGGFAKLANRHLAKVKVFTAAVFFGLGIGLLLIIKK